LVGAIAFATADGHSARARNLLLGVDQLLVEDRVSIACRLPCDVEVSLLTLE